MAYRRYRSRGGTARALQHIEEARRLSFELGGTDQDVKRYFFSLPGGDLRQILEVYGKKHGRAARAWAEKTLPKWRSGRVKMSGVVASRLFNLLPPRMPPSAKYALVENLWQHFGPSSRKRLEVGTDADLDQVIEVVRAHIEEVVINYKIPANLERRFEWLSAGDVHIKQDLLNHFRNCEKSLVLKGVSAQIPVMLEHIHSDYGRYTRRLAHVLKVGKHELEVMVNRKTSGVVLTDPPWFGSRRVDLRWIWLLVGAGLLLYSLLR